MNDNSFNIKVTKDVVCFLKKIDMYKDCLYKAEDHYTKELKRVARDNKYKEIFDLIQKSFCYDLILKDDSVFQMHKSGDDYRYMFMQSYRYKRSFEEFLCQIKTDISSITEEEKEWYRSYYDECPDDSCYIVRNNPICIRYDVSKSQYKEGIHPYSHLHIGLGNEMRIPVSIILTPEMFVLFSIKMAYPVFWKDYAHDHSILEMHSSFKQRCDKVHKDYWSDIDQMDLYML